MKVLWKCKLVDNKQIKDSRRRKWVVISRDRIGLLKNRFWQSGRSTQVNTVVHWPSQFDTTLSYYVWGHMRLFWRLHKTNKYKICLLYFTSIFLRIDNHHKYVKTDGHPLSGQYEHVLYHGNGELRRRPFAYLILADLGTAVRTMLTSIPINFLLISFQSRDSFWIWVKLFPNRVHKRQCTPVHDQLFIVDGFTGEVR